MKKKFILLILIILICGCSKKNESNITTIIEQESNYIIAINYPVTNTKIDKMIKNEIDNIYNNFKTEYQNIYYSDNKFELNIDYSFHHFGHYINIALFVYINDLNSTNNYVKTFVYDNKNHKILKIEDITDEIEIIDYIIENKYKEKKDYNFIFDNKDLSIYIQNENQYDSIDIPLDDLNLKIDINENEPLKKASATIPKKVIDPYSKMISLTFDDGPSIYTDSILEILKENDCNATFFVLGNKVSAYSDTLIKSLNYGNEIGNHSYNHKWLIKLNSDEIMNQINKTQEIIEEYTGYIPKLIRPTYGSLNDTIKNITDLEIVLWNVDTLDWKYKNSNKIVSNATKKLKDGNIILMHDTHKQTVDALPKIISIIKEKGFECVTVSEMKEANFIREKLNG